MGGKQSKEVLRGDWVITISNTDFVKEFNVKSISHTFTMSQYTEIDEAITDGFKELMKECQRIREEGRKTGTGGRLFLKIEVKGALSDDEEIIADAAVKIIEELGINITIKKLYTNNNNKEGQENKLDDIMADICKKTGLLKIEEVEIY